MTLVDAPPPPGNAFCIDRWEASLVEVTDAGERPFSPFQSVAGHKVRAVTRQGVVPQAYISRNEADAACRASKKRLCAESEWVRACEGRNPTTFPYGNDRKSGWCNDDGKPPVQRLYSSASDAHGEWESMNDPRLNQLPNTVAKTGSHPHCKSSYGAYDMMGNVHEWVDDPAGTFLGGYYLDTSINGDGCHYKTVAHDAAYHDYSTGFRCCADAK
jgi:formylglycine-generating enzyme required for sulfatase activity